jgi:hypothetical protein
LSSKTFLGKIIFTGKNVVGLLEEKQNSAGPNKPMREFVLSFGRDCLLFVHEDNFTANYQKQNNNVWPKVLS